MIWYTGDMATEGKGYWNRQTIFLLIAVVLFGVFAVAGFGIAFDPLEHAAGFLGAGLVAFAASFFP